MKGRKVGRSTQTTGIVSAIVLVALLGSAMYAGAQVSPKASGQYGKGFWDNHRAAQSMRHARENSNQLYRYQRWVPAVEPEVVRSEATQLGQNIEKSQKDVAALKKSHGSNQDIVSNITVIEQHLAKAAEQHKMLHEECQKDTMNTEKGMECCNAITKELDKAIAEHAGLMRKLKIDLD